MKTLLLGVAVVLGSASTSSAQYFIPWVVTGSTVYVQNIGQTTVYAEVGFDNGVPSCGFNVSPGTAKPCPAPSGGFAGYAWAIPSGSSSVVAVADVFGTVIVPSSTSTTFSFAGSYNNNGLAIMNNTSTNSNVTIGVYDTSWNLLFSNDFTINAYSSTGKFIYEYFPPGPYGALPAGFNVYVSAGWYFGAVATDCSGSPCSVVAHN